MAIARSAQAELFGSSSTDAVARVPRALAFRYDVLPLALADGVLSVAVPSPDDGELLDRLRGATRLKILARAAPREYIRERLRVAYGADEATADAMEHRPLDAPSVRAVDLMFARAIGAHASDIHVEPRDGGGHVRLRIDGVLRDGEVIPSDLFAAFVSRIKLIAGMDIADKRQAQDGRSSIAFEQRVIDARVASMPTIGGEKLVIRLLDNHTQSCDIAALGMSPALLAAYRRVVRSPWGFVVVTGPTGSGKTTTLYASLAELDTATKSICSVEDPVEMRVGGVAQVQVNPRAGMTFASALRGFMRQDPNVIMVGEMRDAETAAVAISASLAGQLVFTTLHSNDAPRTVERLVELGVARHSLAAGLSAILAQRLVRRLCEGCRRHVPIRAVVRERFALRQTHWWEPGACGACAHSGYIARVGVYELLVMNDALRDAIATGSSSVHIAQLAHQTGYRPMFDDGLAKVLTGETSFEELVRVVAWSDER